MKRTILLMIAATVVLSACNRSETATGEQTATIEAAEPRQGEMRPEELTQTVELDDGRSVDEGASIIEPETATTTTATTTTTTATTTTTTTTRPATPPPPRKQ